jgi:hypothetical protein
MPQNHRNLIGYDRAIPLSEGPKEGNMTTMDLNQGSGNKGLKQTDKDSWTSLYLPAICAAILMGGVLFLALSFSRKSPNVAKVTAPAPAVTAPAQTTPVASVPETPKKKAVKKRRPANATYVNSTYGISFSYPRKYSLQSGDKLAAAPLPISFLKEGAVPVAAVDMPDDMYPETDFSSALLNVSVNQNMTSDECMQFVPASKDAGEVKPTIVKLGANEYSVFEQINGEGDRKSDLKYFHLFKNNACYEFALDVDTTVKPDSDLAQVDRGKVFQKLEKILTSARIKDLQPTEVENAAKTPAATTPVTEAKTADSKTTETKVDDKTEKAQVVTPEQK